MLEDFVTDKSKDIVSDAYIHLYNSTNPYYAIRTFNRFNRKYTHKHILQNQNIIGLSEYGNRKAKVFDKYVNMAVREFNPFNENIYARNIQGE